MRSSARSALLALLTCLCFAVSLFAQTPSKQPPAVKTPRGSVSGRITIKDKPAPGVAVGLRNSDFTNPFESISRTVTGADGVYRITNVSAGSYNVTIAAPAYVATEMDGRRTVVLGEDENIENLNFSLVRGGVITGKVTDGEGRPVIAQQVEVYSVDAFERQSAQQSMLYPTTTGQTDDRGVYRIFGIAAGRYKVAAGRGDERFADFSNSQTKYKQVFHPDVGDPTKAVVIEVSEGSEAKDVDIALGRAVQTFSASGRMINSENGAPVPNLRFGLQRVVAPQRFEYVNSIGTTNARGDFVIEGLIPGKYNTMFFANEGSELRADSTTFEVIDSDVSGVTIKVSRGATVSGIVILETDDKSARSRLAEITMRGYVQINPGYGNSVSSTIAADGSFRLAGLPGGAVNIAISGAGPYPPKGFAISRIEREGIAAPRIEVKDGEQVTGVKVFIGYGNATLRGVVKIDDGPLPPGTRVFLRLTKPGENSSFIRPIPVDDRGHFLLDGITPGAYELNAQVFGTNVKAPKPIKQTVNLVDGVVTDVTITFDFTTPANP